MKERTDTERLDWFDSTLHEDGEFRTRFLVRRVPGGSKNPAGIEVQPCYPPLGIDFGHPNIRAAIDAAMDAEEAK